MPRKSHKPTEVPRTRSFPTVKQQALPAILLLLTAAVPPISQLTLGPVYGSIPSADNHRILIILAFLLGFLLRATYRQPFTHLPRVLPIWAFAVPVLQAFLLPYSRKFGPVLGPILNASLSCHLTLVFSAYTLAEAWEIIEFGAQLPQWSVGMMKAGLLLPIILAIEKNIGARITEACALAPWLTPVHLQVILAACYALLFPSAFLLLAVPALFHTAVYNPHVSPAAVNNALQPWEWTLLERQWSTTGYISVLENSYSQYRVLRCDHSLLGGEWLLTDERRNNEGWLVNEPVYAVFEMLEAVRLVQVERQTTDAEAQALVIGLGIGTAPKALVAHGINTTVVELDPVVHAFATRYFGLPANHTSVLQDAVSWVKSERATTQESDKKKQYDYIIHDVFTGGAEPLALFNADFFHDLRALLRPKTGVIAINYAGDLATPLTRRVLSTILHVFSHQCKVFRDAPAAKHDEAVAGTKEDFLNMVVFCRNGPGPVTFRPPRAEDYLGSKSRQHYLLPKPEHEIPIPLAALADERNDATSASAPSPPILELGGQEAYAKQQVDSAIRHWQIMRKVLPDAVWELW